MGFFESIGLIGTKPKAKSMPTTSAEQQEISRMLGGLFRDFLGGGLRSPYPQPLTAPMPDLFGRAYQRLSDRFGEYRDIVTGALTRATQGIPAYMFDESATAKRWREGFAIPVMETWRQTVRPLIEKQFAGIPGGFYSRDKAAALRNEANRYFAQAVQPRLYEAYQTDIQRGFESREAAAAQSQAAAQMLSTLPGREFMMYGAAAEALRQAEQLPLTAAYGEYRNLLNAALGYAATPTVDTAVFQGQQGMLLPLIAAMAPAPKET